MKVFCCTPDVKRFRGFVKIYLKAGESKTVTFLPVKELVFVNIDEKRILEAGNFKTE